eukprot:gene53514-9882_t
MDTTDSKTLHSNFSHWMNATGRHMHLELCRGYSHPIPDYVAEVANSWRVAGDNWDWWPHTVETINDFVGDLVSRFDKGGKPTSSKDAPLLLWARHLTNGVIAMGVTNIDDSTLTLTAPVDNHVRTGEVKVTVAPHDTLVWALTKAH